jgi:hypothetical protein
MLEQDDLKLLGEFVAEKIEEDGVSPEITKYVQRLATERSMFEGEIDGAWGPTTDVAWRQLVGLLPFPLDPSYEPSMRAHEFNWPGGREADLTEFYGPPGTNIVRFTLPFPMRIAWDTNKVVTTTSANKKCVEAFQAALENILTHYGDLETVREHRMDLYGGIYNKRRIRGGRAWSVHSWGAAIDLDPAKNGLGVPWPDKATMPLEVVEIFEDLGANAGARWRSRPDAMHFQWTK